MNRLGQGAALAGGRSTGAALGPLRTLGEQARSRAAGAPLVSGNRIRLLRDATENYPAWLEALEGARRSAYIIADDLGRAEGEVVGWAGLALLGAALLSALFPRAVLVPVTVVLVWFGVVLIAHAVRVRRRRGGAGPEESFDGRRLAPGAGRGVAPVPGHRARRQATVPPRRR